MDLLIELEELALATRMKRLAESLQQDVARIYQEQDLDFDPKWFTMLYVLYQKKSMSIMEIAEDLRLSHVAIVQFAQEMKKQKLISSVKDRQDARRRVIRLTAKGEETFQRIQPLLSAIKSANREFLKESRVDFLEQLKQLEQQLDERSMYARIKQQLKSHPLALVLILLLSQILLLFCLEAALPFYSQILGQVVKHFLFNIPMTAQAMCHFIF